MRRFLTAVLAIVSIASLAPEAAGQCSITHTAVTGAWQLCAVGGSEWQWSGPGSFSAATSCVTVTGPGTYTLRIWDGMNGLWGLPCSWSFASAPAGPACSIAGDDSVCAGETTMWCGPDGAAGYSWTLPSGGQARATCILVGAPGEYTLEVMNANGTVDTCRRTLTVHDCSLPRIGALCPLSARAWSQSCGDRRALVSRDAFAQVAARVDERSSVWSYGGTSAGLCDLLRRDRHGNDAALAKRHFAAVLANLSAAEIGVTAAAGRAVGLDEHMSLDGIRGMTAGRTLADWVSTTEARFSVLANASSRSRGARDEYRRIARQARAIDRPSAACGVSLSAMLDDDDEDLMAASPANALDAGATVSGTTRIDPLAGAARLRWTLQRSDAVELVIMDITGRRIRRLASGVYAAGTHEFTWDGRDDDGRTQRAGAYFVAGRVGTERLSQRLFLLR